MQKTTAKTRRRGEGTGRRRGHRTRGRALQVEAPFGAAPKAEPRNLPLEDRAVDAAHPAQPVSPDGADRIEEVLLTTWAALGAGHPVECPVCTGTMTAAKGCRDCGARLS